MSFEGWKKVKLGDVAEVQTGPFGSQLHNSDYISEGTPIITVEHLGENSILHYELPRVSDFDKERLKKYTIFEGDIVFSRVGSVDRRAYVSKMENGWLFSGRCLRVRVTSSNVCAKYLSYYFGLESFKEYIRAIAVGATMPSINTKILSDAIIEFIPPLPVQKAIATTLSSLDDKIELNNQMNNKFEEMAQVIFKSWFLDFEPFKDGEFEKSELGMIPMGWKVGCLEDIVNQIVKTCRRKDIPCGSRYVGLEHIPRKHLVLGEYGDIEDVASDKLSFSRYNLLFGKIRPYFHKVSIAPWDGYCSTDAIVLAPKTKEFYEYMALTIFSDIFVQFSVQISHGTKMPRAEWKDLKKYKLVIPPNPILKAFNDVIMPVLEKMLLNSEENDRLVHTRNSLLPKLMSGEIKVPIEEGLKCQII